MAKTESLKETLQSCFSEEWLRETASATGVVRRRSKIDIVAFFWTLVLGFGTGTHRSLAELRRSFESSTGVHIVPSTFYDRFTPALCRLLKLTVARVCATLSEPTTRLGGVLEGFRDLVVTDATVMSLHDLLAGKFKATRTNHTKSALKMQMVMSVLAAGPRFIQLFGETAKEHKKLKVGKWLEGRLLLFDLGYYQFNLFERIDRNGGFFISRAAVDRGHEKILQSYLNKSRSRNIAYRLSPQEIARTYAARWEVELLFKELKSQYRIDQIPSAKKHIVEALIYIAILTMTVSRLLQKAVRARAKLCPSRMPVRRWAITFKTVSMTLLALLLDPRARHREWGEIESFLAHEAKDPNVERPRNISDLVA